MKLKKTRIMSIMWIILTNDADFFNDDPEYTNPEEGQSPKLIAIKTVQGNEKKKKKEKKEDKPVEHLE